MATVYRHKGGIAIVPARAADNPKRGDMNVTARPRGRRAPLAPGSHPHPHEPRPGTREEFGDNG